MADLTGYAAQQQREFDQATSPVDRKQRGHFGTPPNIALFMAAMFSLDRREAFRVLDPGAGVGTLSAAVCQSILARNSRVEVQFELWENDPSLLPFLNSTMRRCQETLRLSGHNMEFTIHVDDFILAHAEPGLFQTPTPPSFDLAILNPPYFKLRKESPQAQAMRRVIHGQPNIYALFMAVAAELLLPSGEMVAITPRSYFNGLYFKRFRNWFFQRMAVRQVHIFESRTAAFKDDSVLQENVILHAGKDGAREKVLLTSSLGRDLTAMRKTWAPYDKLIDNSGGEHLVRVSNSDVDHEIVSAMSDLPCRFRGLGFEVSTGPVVTFRSTEFLRYEPSEDTAPLLWMHNVRPFITQFPTKNAKPTHIEISQNSRKLLLPAKTYVLLKRFTAKEEKRRLVAGIMVPTDSYSKWVGLENHLNYVYRKGGELAEEEAFGLAAFFNSALVDRYFRSISGSTQVNAGEIRAMPLPDRQTLMLMGSQVSSLETRNNAAIEEIVGQALRLPPRLLDQLVEVSQ